MGTTLDGSAAPATYKPTREDVLAFLRAAAVMGETERFRQLDRYEAHYKGTQYKHQQYDWSGQNADNMETISPKVAVPSGFESGAKAGGLNIRMKRPTAPLNLSKTIVDRFTGLLFSATRRPKILVQDDPDSDALLKAVIKQGKFWTKMRSLRGMGGSVGSGCITTHLRDGKFSFEVHNSKNITVVWEDRRTWTPAGILIQYTYQEERDGGRNEKTNEQNEPQIVDFLARRIITAWDDVVYRPVELTPGIEPTWDPDPQLSVNHNLGFFPGYWVQNTAESDDKDGEPDCQGAWQMLDTLDRLISQINKGTVLNLDPTLWMNYDPKEVAMQGGIRKGSDHSLNLGTKGNAGYLEINGSGIEAGMKLADYFEKKVLSLTRCVLLDPSQVSGAAQSAKSIEYLYEPMIERCDDFREQYGEAICGILGIVLKIVRKFQDMGTFPIGKTDPVTGQEIMAKFELDLPLRPIKVIHPETGNLLDHLMPQRAGKGESIELIWGPYFAPTDADNQMRIQNALAAKGELVPLKNAVEHVADLFGIEDADSVVSELEKAQEEMAAKMFVGAEAGVPADGEEEDPNAPPNEDGPPPPENGPPTPNKPNGKNPNPFAGRP